VRPPFTQGHSHDSLVVIETSTLIIIIIIIIRRLVTRAMSEYMTESEERAVARWEAGSCLRMVRKTKQVGFEPVFESLQSWSISYGGWDFIATLGAQ